MVQPAEIASHIDWCESEKAVLAAGSFKVFQSFYVALNSVQKKGKLCDYPHRNGPAIGANCCSILQGNVMQVTLLS